MSSTGRSDASRETRLLVATIAVSIVVLLVLSRFRFPAESTTTREAASAQPLARLAARAAFDDLSLAVRELSGRVDGSLLAARVSTRGGADRPLSVAAVRHLPALRVRDDTALVVLPDDSARVEGLVGIPGTVEILARDPIRGITLLRTPTSAAPVLSVREGQQPLATPGYVAVAEASAAGSALRPVFVGRSDGIGDPRWDVPLLTLGRGAAGDAGAPVFTLDGRFAGLVATTDAESTLIPGPAVLALADQLLRGGVPATGDIGVTTQLLDDVLAAATGVSAGAAIAAVDPDGPAANVLAPGDVVTAVNGQPMRSPEALRLRVARTAPGTSLSLTVRRAGAFATVPVPVRARPARQASTASAGAAADATAPRPDRTLGLTLRPVADRGAEVVRVQPGSAAAAAGVEAGDLITSVGAARRPGPGDITTAFAALAPGRSLFLSVERAGRPLLVALQR